jgi:Transposase, Mutator family
VRQARERGLSLTGPGGLLKQSTKTVLETALNEELTEHLGYEKHDPPGAGAGNIRNGTWSKTVLTEANGLVEIEVPRDRAGTFDPQIVKKRQRRLSGVDEIVLSLYAKGLTTGEISAQRPARRRVPCRHGGGLVGFASANHLAGYAGLAPTPRDSGRPTGNLHRRSDTAVNFNGSSPPRR